MGGKNGPKCLYEVYLSDQCFFGEKMSSMLKREHLSVKHFQNHDLLLTPYTYAPGDAIECTKQNFLRFIWVKSGKRNVKCGF